MIEISEIQTNGIFKYDSNGNVVCKQDAHKDLLGDNESEKYWLNMFNELKNNSSCQLQREYPH